MEGGHIGRFMWSILALFGEEREWEVEVEVLKLEQENKSALAALYRF